MIWYSQLAVRLGSPDVLDHGAALLGAPVGGGPAFSVALCRVKMIARAGGEQQRTSQYGRPAAT
jgi:hypothetical protein